MAQPAAPWPILCAGLIVLTSLSSSPSAPTAQAQGKRFNVVQWEHRVFQMDPTEYRDKVDYRAILAREGARKAEAAFEEHVLSHLGKQGWELVALERLRTNVVYFYLKRRLP